MSLGITGGKGCDCSVSSAIVRSGCIFQDGKNSLSRGKPILSKISGQKNEAGNWLRACCFQRIPSPRSLRRPHLPSVLETSARLSWGCNLVLPWGQVGCCSSLQGSHWHSGSSIHLWTVSFWVSCKGLGRFPLHCREV